MWLSSACQPLSVIIESQISHLWSKQHKRLRDLFIAGHDLGFWQAAIRDAGDPNYGALTSRVRDTEHFTIDLLYGDEEGGQRTITRFQIVPVVRDEQTRWFPSTVRHWNLDRPDPR